MPATDVPAWIRRAEDAIPRQRSDDPPMERHHLIKRRPLLRTLVIALAIFGLTVQAAMAADATVLKLAPVSGPPGTVTKLTGSGFAPGETVQLQFEATSASVAVADGA